MAGRRSANWSSLLTESIRWLRRRLLLSLITTWWVLVNPNIGMPAGRVFDDVTLIDETRDAVHE